jgi:hypothetical protein
MRRIAKTFCSLGFVTLCLSTSSLVRADNPSWGTAKDDGCIDIGWRQYAARLWNTQGDWDLACKNMPADASPYGKPHKCDNHGLFGGEWGVWLVNDQTCKAKWDVQQSFCNAPGKEFIAAKLFDIPSNVTWETACRQTPLDVNGSSYLASKCTQTPTGEWGEFSVDNDRCKLNPDDLFESISKLSKELGSPNFSRQCLQEVFVDKEWATDGCSNTLRDTTTLIALEKFFPACAIHDYCYAIPWNGYKDAKKLCDTAFYLKLNDICRANPWFNGSPCGMVASYWTEGVTMGGQPAFDNAQKYRNKHPLSACQSQ